MTLELLKIVRANEVEVASEIRQKHEHEISIVEEALEELLQAFNEFSSIKGSPDNDLESARLHLTVRSFSSLLNAKQVLELGYYQQAMTLIRMAMEDQLVAEDAEGNPPTLAALMREDGKLGTGKLTYSNMASRISEKAEEAWKVNYGILSAHAAHPRTSSLRGLSVPNPDGGILLTPGSNYDEIWVNVTLSYLARELVQVMFTAAKLTGQVEGDWPNSALPVFSKVQSLWQDLEAWASSELEELN